MYHNDKKTHRYRSNDFFGKVPEGEGGGSTPIFSFFPGSTFFFEGMGKKTRSLECGKATMRMRTIGRRWTTMALKY